MRRNDREVTNQADLIHIMEQCDVCRLALNDDGYPYILPLNFGMQMENGMPVLYFHGAAEGTKYQLIARDNRASFEMDCGHQLITDAEKGYCYCTMEYESVIGRGHVEILSDEEKQEALQILMDHYHTDGAVFNPAAMSRTTVFKLTVEHMTGKKRRKNHN